VFSALAQTAHCSSIQSSKTKSDPIQFAPKQSEPNRTEPNQTNPIQSEPIQSNASQSNQIPVPPPQQQPARARVAANRWPRGRLRVRVCRHFLLPKRQPGRATVGESKAATSPGLQALSFPLMSSPLLSSPVLLHSARSQRARPECNWSADCLKWPRKWMGMLCGALLCQLVLARSIVQSIT